MIFYLFNRLQCRMKSIFHIFQFHNTIAWEIISMITREMVDFSRIAVFFATEDGYLF